MMHHRHRNVLFMIAILTVFLAGQFALQAQAQTTSRTLRFAWDYNDPPPDLEGFRLYQAEESGKQVIDKTKAVATAPAAARTLSLPGVTEGTHYWVMTAFDKNGNESEPSGEASYTLDLTAPKKVPGALTVEVEVDVRVNVIQPQAAPVRAPAKKAP